ncbi:hypothetical protein Ahia01_001417200, partial [Argonauta hians]
HTHTHTHTYTHTHAHIHTHTQHILTHTKFIFINLFQMFITYLHPGFKTLKLYSLLLCCESYIIHPMLELLHKNHSGDTRIALKTRRRLGSDRSRLLKTSVLDVALVV